MKLLFLYGLNSNASLWDKLLPMLYNIEYTIVSYPHCITQNAESPGDLTKWVFDEYGKEQYDIIVGHSLGGIVALACNAVYKMRCKKIIIIDTSLKPANVFYRNLLTRQHMEQYGDKLCSALKSESIYFSKALTSSVQEDYDYTAYVEKADAAIYGIYGDRNQNDYQDKYHDLCLDERTLQKITFYFIEDSCHLPMIENPKGLYGILEDILHEK